MAEPRVRESFLLRTSSELVSAPAIEARHYDEVKRASITAGTEALGEAINRAIAGYAMRKGITPHEAQWLLLNCGCIN